jgi:type IV pilus assembly protein PilX
MKTRTFALRDTSVAAMYRQRGVVLFVALIAMVVMSLAGVALIRSVDTTGSVAGNLAFREASMPAVNMAVEEAVQALYLAKPKVPATAIVNPELDDSAHRYYATLQPGELQNGVPAVLSGTYSTVKAAYPFSVTTYPTTKAEVRAVIERVCHSDSKPFLPLTGANIGKKLQYCDTLPPKVSVAKTSMKKVGATLPPIPLYRVTIRVDLPGTNTTSYAQVMLH